MYQVSLFVSARSVLQYTACLVINTITVGNFAFLFNCMPIGQNSDSMAVPTCSLCFQRIPFLEHIDFTTAGDWDCVAAVERLPALHYSVDFIFLSFGIMGFIVEL